jgi:hypothetical protein
MKLSSQQAINGYPVTRASSWRAACQVRRSNAPPVARLGSAGLPLCAGQEIGGACGFGACCLRGSRCPPTNEPGLRTLAGKQARELREEPAKEHRYKLSEELGERLGDKRGQELREELAKELTRKLRKELSERLVDRLTKKLLQKLIRKLVEKQVRKQNSEQPGELLPPCGFESAANGLTSNNTRA